VSEAGESDKYILDDGSKIAIVGGGPTGSFFGIFALKMAQMLGKELSVTIYEPKVFTKDGPGGCNRCGGIISELLVQMLAVEGINLPDTVVQKGINSYRLHTSYGSVQIETPTHEKTIATVYRGGGPKGIIGKDKESFDNFLLGQAIKEGAVHRKARIDRIDYSKEKPVLFSKEESMQEADLVVGAFGVNSTTPKIFEDIGIGYRQPETVTAAIAEIGFDEKTVTEHFGNSINLFLLPDKGIKFAAMIPKGTYVTVCILGKEMKPNTVKDFIEKPVVKAILPDDRAYQVDCSCLPKMNIGAPKKPFANRVVICGDAGSTRLFKDGLGAAYLMGKAAAKTAVFEGVGEEHFSHGYFPVYKSIIEDNYFGKYLYAITDIYRKYSVLTKGMLRVVEKEQMSGGAGLSEILWDMFTGNERYKKIFPKALNPRMHLSLWKAFAGVLLRR
jgi:flavin-dependent dehydrogenase